MIPPGYVSLTCDDPSLELVVLLGADPVHITGGNASWEITARPRQVSMTTWSGNEPLQVELPLMFDGWTVLSSQEPRLSQLYRVWRGDAESPPGVLAVEGVSLPADQWVIEALTFGDPIIDPGSGERLRQPVSLTLREYVPPTYLSLRKRALQGTKGKTKVISTKKGDTPAIVARRQHCKWTDIRALNPTLVKKANQTLKTNTKLRVPVAKTKERKAKGGQRGTSSSKSRS